MVSSQVSLSGFPVHEDLVAHWAGELESAFNVLQNEVFSSVGPNTVNFETDSTTEPAHTVLIDKLLHSFGRVH